MTQFPTWRRGTHCVFLARMLLFCFLPTLTSAQTPPPSEYQVKAAFLYNFAKFVEWPNSPDAESPLILGVIGDEKSATDLMTINGRLIKKHPVQVVRFPHTRRLPKCHILFILPSESMESLRLKNLRDSGVLTVCDERKDFARTGAIINFIKTQEGKIRFEVNIDAAKRAGLKIQSPLLALAHIVREPVESP
jgi:hypothetical protein